MPAINVSEPWGLDQLEVIEVPEHMILEPISTPVGTALVATDETGVLRAFNWMGFEARMNAWIERRYPSTRLEAGRGPANVRAGFEAYFAGDRRALEAVPWRAAGTDFQLKVWAALCMIPAGETLSYQGLAQCIGRPTAMRAVGMANGSNPISLVVPCHRVIGANGSLTGYGGGLERKRWLLAHEGAALRE